MIKIEKFCPRGSRSSDNAEFDHLVVVLLRTGQKCTKNSKTHVYRSPHLSCDFSPEYQCLTADPRFTNDLNCCEDQFNGLIRT